VRFIRCRLGNGWAQRPLTTLPAGRVRRGHRGGAALARGAGAEQRLRARRDPRVVRKKMSKWPRERRPRPAIRYKVRVLR
jgi:hypothetical protein